MPLPILGPEDALCELTVYLPNGETVVTRHVMWLAQGTKPFRVESGCLLVEADCETDTPRGYGPGQWERYECRPL